MVLSRVEIAERMTAGEFFQHAPEARKAELIEGVMVMPAPPLVVHERLQIFLLTLLRMFAEEGRRGEVFGSRTAVELDEQNVVEPDIFFLSRERLHLVERRGVGGAPDFVIEILSAGTAHPDRGSKFRAYERAGVRELWLIDPHGPAGSEFFQLRKGQFFPVMPDARGRMEATALPSFRIETAWLWPEQEFVAVRTALQQIGGR